MAVIYVRSMNAPLASIQEWRSAATGRLHEVEEAASYAPGAGLEPGAEGWLLHVEGRPVVGATPVEAQRMARRSRAKLHAPRDGGGRRGSTRPGSAPSGEGGGWWAWAFLALLVGAILLAFLV